MFFNIKFIQRSTKLFEYVTEANLRLMSIVLNGRELKDRVAEADAACGLGQVYQQMGEYATALKYHQVDLDIAEEMSLAGLQGRACGNLGSVHESLGNLDEAVRYQEQHLSVAAQTNDKLAKTVAFSSLGKNRAYKVNGLDRYVRVFDLTFLGEENTS